MVEIDDLKIQFYAVSSILGFFIIILFAIVINLAVKVKNLRKHEDDDDYDDDEAPSRHESPVPSSVFSLPKPNVSKSWQDGDSNIQRQHDNKDFNVSKSWQGYIGNRNQQQKSTDYKRDDNINNRGYDDRNSAFRNPMSGPKVPQFRLPSTNSSNQDSGYRRDFQRNNSYY